MSTSYLASIDRECPTCGTSVIDLIDVRKTDGGTKWLVQCGWCCLRTWLIDPMPGVLDDDDAKRVEEVFRVRGGRFDGESLDEIAESGNRWYIVDLARLHKRAIVSSTAKNWLDNN